MRWKKFTESRWVYLVGPIIFLFLWEGMTRTGRIDSIIMAPPSAVLKVLVGSVKDGSLFGHLTISILRVVQGFAVGSLLGLAVGATTGFSRTIDRLLEPVLGALRAIPFIAFVPMLILWLGIGEGSKIALVAIGAFFPVEMSVAAGVRNVDDKFMEVARVFEKKTMTMLRRVIIPAAMPEIFTGLRQGLTRAWLAVVLAEYLGSTSGIGYLLVHGREIMQTDVVLMSVLAIGVIAKCLDSLLKFIEARSLKWRTSFGGY